MKVIKINSGHLIKMMSNFDDKNVEITLSSKTIVQTNKNVVIDGVKQPNPFYDKIVKFSIQKIVVGINYYKMLVDANPGLVVEVKENYVGRHINGSILQNRNDDTKHYLYYHIPRGNYAETIYQVDNQVVSKEIVEPYFRPSQPISDTEIIVRAISLSNIIYLKIGGVMFVLDETVTEPTLVEKIVRVKTTRKPYNRNYIMTSEHKEKIRKGLLIYWTLKKSGVLVGV